VEGDGIEGVLGGRGTFGQRDRDGFADIADLVVGDDGLLERLEGGRGVLPQRNGGDRGADIRRRDDGVHARPGAGGGGSVRAAAVSIERMRPCATELRRITACRRFSRARSSTNWPRPRSRRKSSTRSIALPMKALVLRFRSMSDDDGCLFVE